MSAKTATKPKTEKTAADRGFEMPPPGKIVSSEKVELEPRKVSQKYLPLVAAVQEMKVGQTLYQPCPLGKDLDTFRTSVAATLKKRVGHLIAGRLRFGKTKDGQLAIQMESKKAK